MSAAAAAAMASIDYSRPPQEDYSLIILSQQIGKIGFSFFDQSEHQCWEVFWDDEKAQAHVVLKRLRVAAQDSQLATIAVVVMKGNKWAVTTDQQYRAVILHHMVDWNKYWASRQSQCDPEQLKQHTTFWNTILPELPADTTSSVPEMAIEAMKEDIKKVTSRIADKD